MDTGGKGMDTDRNSGLTTDTQTDRAQVQVLSCAFAAKKYISMQVCLVHLQLEQFSRKSIEIEPGTIEMLSTIELTQYYIQVKQYYKKII